MPGTASQGEGSLVAGGDQMGAMTDRRERLTAIGELQRACRDFAFSMERIVQREEERKRDDPGAVTRTRGTSKPAKRAPTSG